MGRQLCEYDSAYPAKGDHLIVPMQSFFDYDAYKSMLSGESRALYEGQFGEQTQVWRLREVYARQKGGRKPTTPRATNTSPLNAGFELHSSTFDQLVPLLAARNPVSGGGYQPFNVTNAGSVTTAVVRMLESNVHEEYLVAMLGGLEGREIVSEAEVERIVRRRKGKGSDDDDEENVRMSSREPGDEAGDADDLELLLVGTVSLLRPSTNEDCADVHTGTLRVG